MADEFSPSVAAMDGHLRADLDDVAEVLSEAHGYAVEFLAGLDARPAGAVLGEHAGEVLLEQGLGARGALRRFRERYDRYLSGSAGPRYFGFVTGGSTPAAVAGDWLAATFDQNAQLNGETVAPFIERDTLAFLKDLFCLDAAYTGSFVTGATVSNFVNLLVARQKLARDRGIDVARDGLSGLPRVHVLSGSPHSSIYKALAMAGLGRASLETVPCLPDREAVDPRALGAALTRYRGQPVIVVGNAGTVNTGDFDDLQALGALREEYGFWLHVDGAFGLFAGCSPRLRHLVAGINAADSITVDGHKWLNVPYESGVQFTRHLGLQVEVFQNYSPYLAAPTNEPHHYIHLGPENSRRFRALPAWMSLMAYGRAGYREIVERTCALASRLGEGLQRDARFRVLAEVRLHIVCFTLMEGGAPADRARIKRYLEIVHRRGKVYLTPTVHRGVPAIRAALSNWRTEAQDVDLVVEELRGACDALHAG
jgi:glutamate/tyrosine decarboxylase-like PLP-dependent enzyme